MTIGEALARGTALLRQAGIETPSLDASLLLSDILQSSRPLLLAHRDDSLALADAVTFLNLIEQRKSGIAVAYLLGFKEFRNLSFRVNPSVLIPRPDTETLLEAALEYLASVAGGERDSPVLGRRVLDLCTGSGCVAIALKNEVPSLSLCASDLSSDALAVARENALRLLRAQGKEQGAEPVQFYQSDLFDSIPGTFMLIVSNPPYVPSALLDTLALEVQNEPRMALDGGIDGLFLIRRLIKDSILHLDAEGMLLIESGSEQTREIADLLRAEGFHSVRIYKDLAGKERVTGGIVGEVHE
ncbi:peptide chain release factor N(5)-glutamine methyltransferase [Treponema sp.]